MIIIVSGCLQGAAAGQECDFFLFRWLSLELAQQVRDVLFRSKSLGMDEANFLPLLDEFGQYAQEGTVFDIEVFDVGRTNPKGVFDLGDKSENFLEMGFVGDVLCAGG